MRKLTYQALFATLMCVASIIRIPIPISPVPITLQLCVAMVSGIILGKGGAISMIIYVLLGSFGLPVFSGMTGGFGMLFGPTGGFIIGFIPCAFVVGAVFSMSESKFANRHTTMNILLSFLTGLLVLYAFGAIHFSLIQKTTITMAVEMTILPFLVFDALKLVVSAFLAQRLIQFFRRNSR